MGHQNDLPHTFSSLWNFSFLEKKYVEHYGSDDGKEKLDDFVIKGKISPKSEQSDISKLSRNSEEDQFENRSISVNSGPHKRSISECLEDGIKFRTFVIDLPNDLIKKWGDEIRPLK